MSTHEAHNQAYAYAIAIRDNVLCNLRSWRETTLGGTRSLLAEWFAEHLQSIDPNDSVPFEDRATMVADGIIHQWCLQRSFFGNVYSQMLAPGVADAVQRAGMAVELGQLVGQRIDEATRELDAELREMIEEARE